MTALATDPAVRSPKALPAPSIAAPRSAPDHGAARTRPATRPAGDEYEDLSAPGRRPAAAVGGREPAAASTPAPAPAAATDTAKLAAEVARLRATPAPSPIIRPASAESKRLLALADTCGIDRGRLAELGRFARNHGVPESVLLKIAANPDLDAAAKLAAMQTYAVVHDAAHNGKLAPVDALRLQQTFLPALESGKIAVAVSDDIAREGHLAAYDLDENTITVPRKGIDLDNLHDRATVVHEAQHAVQDARERSTSVMEMERDAYRVDADYMLHSVGAVTETPTGPRVDPDGFAMLLRQPSISPHMKREIIESFADATLRVSVHKDERGEPTLRIDPALREALNEARKQYGESFEKMYEDLFVKRALRDGGDEAAARERAHRELSETFRTDGLGR
ncbi:MAG: hypothetical protein HYV63_33795 [Candidatus Schekmanbacteria bacterium]|nr:hypothetical protein [Candidatus Schekmanbacteria bacterium]